MSRGSTPPARPARDAEQAARAAGLHYVSDQLPGISRRRCGRGFIYHSAAGQQLRRATELTRIARLGIPPAYQDVWICPDARGHLQATGRDARGRKQYRYHPRWQQVRGNDKFARMIAFGAALPLLRRQIRQDMAREGLPRRKVLATVAWLLDGTRARIGNAAYARDNQSFGITTLQNRHVSFVRGGGAVLSFRGKGGVPHEIVVDHKRLVQIVRQCRELPGQHLFQYRDRRGLCRRIDSGDVNRYLRRFLQGGFHRQGFPHLECHPALRGAAGRHANPGPARRAQRARVDRARGTARGARAAQHAGGVSALVSGPGSVCGLAQRCRAWDFRHFLCARLRPGRSADIAFSEAARARRRRQGRAPQAAAHANGTCAERAAAIPKTSSL